MSIYRYFDLFFIKHCQPAHILRFGGLDPGESCCHVDDEEEREEDDGEDVSDEDKQPDAGKAIDEPVYPRVGFAVDEPVVGEERGGDEQSVEEQDDHFASVAEGE